MITCVANGTVPHGAGQSHDLLSRTNMASFGRAPMRDDEVRVLAIAAGSPCNRGQSVLVTTNPTPIEMLFGQVRTHYAHVQKSMRTVPALIAPGVFQKWYLVEPLDTPFGDEDVAVGQAFLQAEIGANRLALRNEVGFTVQHRCAAVDIFYVCSWRDNNELWETIYHKPHGEGFSVLPRETKTATFCVWVIPAVAHEQRVWLDFLRSDRGPLARDAYCRDQAIGLVG